MFAAEVVPFAKTGGLADVIEALSLALEKEKQEVVIIMPRYRYVEQAGLNLNKLKNDISFTVLGKNIKVYFVENEAFFNREGLYGDSFRDYPDNLDRFSYYCKRGLELLKEINFRADIIHCHDWQAGLIPVYLRNNLAQDNFFKNSRSVMTVHNIGYQGLFPKSEFHKLGLSEKLFDVSGLEFYGEISLLKGGIVFADIVNTVSPTYAKEIQTDEYGFGLEGLLKERASSVFGILNGLNYDIWNPEMDKYITANFSSSGLAAKAQDKEDLQKSVKLPLKNNVPLFGIVSRLAQQKGFDILIQSIDEICKADIQLVILGAGDIQCQEALRRVAEKHPKMVSFNLGFNDPLAHKIYAGADIFLMPSRYEPCGLGQLIALRYAAIPLVFKTGGLADTVNSENGFVFQDYSRQGLVKVVKKAIAAYKNKISWNKRMKIAMDCDFSWNLSAQEYLKLYAKAKTK
jgi:starch synthase